MSFTSKCLRFEGVDEYVTMGNVLGFDSSDSFSLSFWIKTTATGYVITKREGAALYRGYGVHQNPDTTEFIVCNTSFSNELDVNAPLVADGAWHHVVWTYAGSRLPTGCKCYVDGVSQTISTTLNTLTATSITTAPFNLACRTNGAGCLAGGLDEVAVYNKVLSAAEVTWIFNNGRPRDLLGVGAPSSLLAWWRMGDGDTYPTLLDSSGSGYSGTMTNMEVGDILSDSPDMGSEAQLLVTPVVEASVTGGGEGSNSTPVVDTEVVVVKGYKMRAQDSGAAPPGYVTWSVTGAPDFAGAGYAGGTPTPIGSMIPGSATVVASYEVN